MKRRQFTSLAGAAALTPFAAFAQHDKLSRVADGIAASGADIHSLLVARGAATIFERYFPGFDADKLHDTKSVTKSVASLAFGIAVDRGLIGIDDPLAKYFPDSPDLGLRVSHLLTMSLGLKWVEATPATGDDDNDEARMHRARDPARYVLSLPVTDPPGQKFFYNTGALTLLSVLVREATGRPLDEFAKEVLFEPLGITAWEWTRYRGDSDAGGGLRLRPRDMMKIGQLVLAGGSWNGRRIVSKAWIDASTTPKLEASSGYKYGYLWWLGRSPYNGRELAVIAALGRGGQSIRIVPGLDLVVVVTAGYYQDYSPAAFKVQRDVFTDVLQAIAAPG
ncbi:MAG TPA: serine hydrolase [Reyranella sp.]|nr:serine hydrolase [Reyranella sp.]